MERLITCCALLACCLLAFWAGAVLADPSVVSQSQCIQPPNACNGFTTIQDYKGEKKTCTADKTDPDVAVCTIQIVPGSNCTQAGSGTVCYGKFDTTPPVDCSWNQITC